jgi:hypothetical protein
MSDTKFSEQNIQNRSFNESLEINENLIYGYDGTNARAIKVDANGRLSEAYPHFYASSEADGGYTYVETYNSDGGWQIMRITEATGVAGYASGTGVADAWTNRATHTYQLN